MESLSPAPSEGNQQSVPNRPRANQAPTHRFRPQWQDPQEPWGVITTGHARANLHSNGEFEFVDEGGTPISMLAVSTVTTDAEDVVAWTNGNPNRWFRLYGLGIVLGDLQIQHSNLSGLSLKLYANPRSWLEGKGRGACILDWTANPMEALGYPNSIECETAALEQRLRDTYERLRHVPRISAFRGGNHVE